MNEQRWRGDAGEGDPAAPTPTGLPAALAAFWLDLRRQPLLVLGVLGVTLMAKAGALLPGYAIDDYSSAVSGISDGLLWDVLSKGRVGHWLWLQASTALQVEPTPARILYVSAAIVAYAFLGLAVTRFWRLPGTSWLTLAVACMVANHPYTAEIFTFRIGLPPAAFVMALLGLLLYLASAKRPHLLLGGFGFAFALSFYQIALHFGLMIALLGVLITMVRQMQAGPPPTPGDGDTSVLVRLRREIPADRNAHLVLYIVVGTLSYLVAGRIVRQLIHVDPNYFGLLPVPEMPGRIIQVTKFVAGTFVKPNVLIPPTVQLAFGLVLACVALGLVWLVIRGPSRLTQAAFTLATVAGLAVAFLWTVGVYLLLKGFWPSPRNLAQTGVLWGGCLALAGLAVPRAKPFLLAVAAIIVLSFVGVNQHIFEEQRRLNLRDLLEANRIVARLESFPGAVGVRRVAFIGGQAWYPMGLQRTQWGDMNISAFGAVWSQVPVLAEASGYNFVWATDPAERKAGEAYCATVEPWPGAGAVAIRGDLAFVCMVQR